METFSPPGPESALTDSKPKTQYRTRYTKVTGYKMGLKGRTLVVPTVTVDRNYGLRIESCMNGVRAAFGATIDLSPKSTRIASLAPNETTRLAFYRVGAALKNSFAKARVKPE